MLPWPEYGKPSSVYHLNYAPNDVRDFAKSIITQWGLAAGTIDGEDSAGRAKLRSRTPDEVVMFACDVAEKAYAEFAKRGWLEPTPSITEIYDAGEENAKR